MKKLTKNNQPTMKFVSKGWGFERWIVNKELYCGKLLFMAKDKRLSLHYHKKKDEVFYLQRGKIDLYYSDDLSRIKGFLRTGAPLGFDIYHFLEHVVLEPGSNFYIPPGRIHQMIARSDSEIFEFSTQHFDEDSIRLIKGD